MPIITGVTKGRTAFTIDFPIMKEIEVKAKELSTKKSTLVNYVLKKYLHKVTKKNGELR